MNGLFVLYVVKIRIGADWVICDLSRNVNLERSDDGTYLSLGGLQ